MNECNSIKNDLLEAIEKTNLSEQTKFRLDEIRKLKIILSKKLIKEYHAVKN